MADNDNLLNRLQATFRGEAEELLGSLSSLLIALEKEQDRAERQRLVEALYRKMHTLKGAAQAVNLLEVGEICQSLESLLAALKRGEITLEGGLFDNFHAAVDSIGKLIFPDGEVDARSEQSRLNKMFAKMRITEKSEPLPLTAAAPPVEQAARNSTPVEKIQAGDTVRVSVQVLESLLLQAEELISAKLMASDLADGLSVIIEELEGRKGDRVRGLDLVKQLHRQSGENGAVGKLSGMVEELSAYEGSLENRLARLGKSTGKSLHSLQLMVDTLLSEMKKVHLLPFNSLVEPFPKIIRDLALDLGKKVDLSCSGGELEIDRRILGELKEPLLHIIRNVIDHGIEKPGERQQSNKPSSGMISIDLRHQDGNRAEITIKDDGRGIDLALVKGAAARAELITPEQADSMSDSDALQLIFESGISTSPLITNISGRGLGLAIVREAMEKLGGHAAVSSRAGEGTEFRLVLPLSFATMRALLVETCGKECMIPAANIEQTARVPFTDIKCVENRETVNISGQALSLVRLGTLLELPGVDREGSGMHLEVVILSVAEKRIAVAVNQIIGIQEILAKPLGSQLSRVRNISGATVLGNGSVVPILNVNDLLRSAVNSSAARVSALPSAGRTRAKLRSVLVVEDSITSRTLLKNILESSGYMVKTAVDGIDGLSILKTEEFDIVVSDVEMPRMDGFELTAAIRRDKNLAELPVILVTGMESREDREHGIDVGASAYIVKSSFDQSRLVEAIEKLI
jgi:two-component system, chemotaxis family, sensor kinase CheA